MQSRKKKATNKSKKATIKTQKKSVSMSNTCMTSKCENIPEHVCETHKEEFCNSCTRTYHIDWEISFSPRQTYIKENIDFWETLLEGLMTKMGLDPFLVDFAGELNEDYLSYWKLVNLLKQKLQTWEDRKGYTEVNMEALKLIKEIGQSDLFRVVMMNALQQEINKNFVLPEAIVSLETFVKPAEEK